MSSRTMEFTIPRQTLEDIIVCHYNALSVFDDNESVKITNIGPLTVECKIEKEIKEGGGEKLSQGV